MANLKINFQKNVLQKNIIFHKQKENNTIMQRDHLLTKMKENIDSGFDIIIAGGGATGLGAGVDAASRGYKTLLVEALDFTSGTSSRSTKLIHGGVRYLQQGNITLVMESLHERGVLSRNAPHLIRHQSFIVPQYEWWEGPFYGTGMKLYDILAGKLGLKKSKNLSLNKTLERLPTINKKGLKGGVLYYDCQFDDARTGIALAGTMADEGGIPLNYMKCTGFIKEDSFITGIKAKDTLTGEEYEIKGKAIINASGPFIDELRHIDSGKESNLIAPSQGIHIVLDSSFLPGDSAIMVPHTDDGRVLFAVPWHDKIIIGTTDTEIPNSEPEPKPFKEEIDFLIDHAGKYLAKKPKHSDIKSTFAGIRPLIKGSSETKTSNISRDHHLEISQSGLITISGGKWTTYRKMAEDTIDTAAKFAGLKIIKCRTETLKLRGYNGKQKEDRLFLSQFGKDKEEIKKLEKTGEKLGLKISSRFPYTYGEILWSVRNESPQKLEDILARRTRALFLDAEESIRIAPAIAEFMAEHMGKDSDWIKKEIKEFNQLAKGYLPKNGQNHTLASV
jgi:glycerol-3-phosphate dehydrogenase